MQRPTEFVFADLTQTIRDSDTGVVANSVRGLRFLAALLDDIANELDLGLEERSCEGRDRCNSHDEPSDYPEPDGTCRECGQDLDEDGDHDEHHTLCWACWRAENGISEQPWRKPRPAAGEEPRSYLVGLTDLRAEVKQLQLRVEMLEHLLMDVGRRPAP